jgi:hypothetical protein
VNTARLTLKARSRAERLMHDQCEIRRPSTLGELNQTTGVRAVIPGELVYLGKCRAFTYEPFESTPESGQHVYTIQRKQIHIPVDVTGVEVGDEVTFTAASLDDDLLGRKFRVAGIHNVTFARDRRLLVDEITA